MCLNKMRENQRSGCDVVPSMLNRIAVLEEAHRSSSRVGDGFHLGRQCGSSVAVTATAFFLFATAHSYAQTSAPAIPEGVYSAAIKAIFVLFVLAVVLESGLAVVFNWRL